MKSPVSRTPGWNLVIRTLAEPRKVRLRAHVADDDDARDARELLEHVRDVAERIERLAGVEVSVCGDEHLRRDLAEAIEHAAMPKSGEHDDQMAPRLAVASIAMMASGRLGR